jgi:uncharacterized protein YrrD
MTMASYLTLSEGTPVLATGGQHVGTVQHVLADVEEDIFDGLVIDTRFGPGGRRFVDAPHVAGITDDAVTLALTEREVEQLPEPTANPAVLEADPVPPDLGDKLKRAWDMITGKG